MMTSLPRVPAALLAVSALALAGCASTDDGAADTSVSVDAQFYPLAFMVSEVGGDRVAVETIIPTGAELHAYEVSPQQVDRIGSSDMVVYVTTLTAAVDEAVAANPPAVALDVTQVIELRQLTESDAHEPEDESEEEHSGEEAGGFDPHVWLDAAQMPLVVDAIAAELSALDPAGADTYATNAATLSARFEALDAAYTAGLADCDSRTFVIAHPAFGYIADRYDLEQIGISGIDEETEPSPARLAEIGALAEAEGVTTVFFGSTSSPKVAEVFAESLGLDVAVLSGISSVPEGQDYFDAAEANLEALQTALGCS